MCSRGSRAAHIRCRGDPPRVLVCLNRATFHARGHLVHHFASHANSWRRWPRAGSPRPPRPRPLYTAPPLACLANELSSQGTDNKVEVAGTHHFSCVVAVNRDARIVHLDPSIYRRNAQGRPRSGAGRHANATASAPAARRGLAPPPSAAAPDAPLRLVSKDETPQSLREGRRRGAGRRRRADGVREGTGQDPSRSRFEED